MSVEQLYQELESKFRTLRPGDDPAPLRAAFDYAEQHHKGQLRDSGEPYLVHPLQVAHILADMQMDLTSMQTGLLHDVVEDTSAGIEEVQKRFGPEVARCVDGVTKISKLNLHSREAREAESMRKMLLAMVSDIRVIIVKLADRLHNMRTLGAVSRERQERTAQETLDIYAPIAHRLGMGKIRGELEDLAFAHLEPEAWAELVQQIESKRQANDEMLEKIRLDINVKLQREDIPARVDGRLKRAYSIYQKLKRQRIPIDQVYDLMAVRIITDSVKNCYAALGVIHNEWHPIPGRIKDFIAIPRPNLYQSLHTSVMGPGGLAFEVQIRTEEMHRIAEEGIAAHWKYKEGKKGLTPDDQRIAWLRQLVEWQREMRDPGEFMSTLKVDLYPEEAYTFTPMGKVIVLPRDATPIDFAYAIHSDVGHRCVGAKVNGRIVPLRYNLKNGDVVEILTQQGHTPSKDWLNLVNTSRARNKIKHFINQSAREKAIEIGEKYLEKEARRFGVSLARVVKTEFERVSADYGCSKMEDLYAALGYGKYSARQVLHKLSPELVPEREPAPESQADGAQTTKAPAFEGPLTPEQVRARQDTQDLVIKVKGCDDLMVYRARCCNPIKGESIVGYVTRGKGVAVHAMSCTNVQKLLYEVERKIDVEWARSTTDSFAVRMVIHTDDRPGILSQLTTALFNENTNIRSLEARGDDKNGSDGAIVEMTVEVKDKRQLEKVSLSIRRIPGVRDIERVQ